MYKIISGARINICGLVMCVILFSGAQAQQSDSPATRMIEVDGHSLRVQTVGLASRKSGTPVVVLEAGLTNSLEVWTKVLPEIASFAPVIAYDRAGLGSSAWDNKTPTPEHATGKLRRLLLQMDVMPPYLLVGYSWGGTLMRYYAGSYPEDVAGIVYVDPGPIITESLEDQIAPFDSVGAGRAGFDAMWSAFGAVFDRASTAAKAEYDVMRSLMAREKDQRGLKPVPDVPVAVIVSAKPYPFFLKVPYDQEAHFRADVRHRIRTLQEWALASSKGTLVVSNTTTHAIPKEDPELIVWAIRRLME